AEPILARRHWVTIVLFGGLITAATLAALSAALFWLDLPVADAVSVSFLTLASAQLWHVVNMRDLTTPLWNNDVVRNPYIWAATAICIALLAAAVSIPPLASVLGITGIDARGWLLVLVAGGAPVLAVETARFLLRCFGRALPSRSL
ncbi:MAG TPA: cation-translocating P-type ATPase C-terminal domain-containing protein, partial [Afifellaceae bacterium]|nr:cation-translocating P-type ATPase C-terminal domain-containing protein [Afifellaceae bacterium]